MTSVKKIVLSLVVLIAGVSIVSAQEYERAIGLRLGTMVGASYKQFVNSSHAIEAILDLDIIHSDDMSLRATGLYEFHFPIRSVDGMSWYLGPGATLGVILGNNSDFLLGFDGIGGVEYKFAKIPLCFSLDFNPKLYLIGYDYVKFSPANVGVTIRYTF